MSVTTSAANTRNTPASDPDTTENKTRERLPLWTILTPMLGGLAVAIAGAVSVGTVNIPFGDVWAIVAQRIAPGSFDSWWTDARDAIVIDSRLPRALTAAVVGAALAIAGAVAQAVTRNPLADPFLLGVSSGAGFGVVLVTVLGVGGGALGVFTLPAAAFLGALLPLAGAIAISVRTQAVTAIVLVGVAMSMVFSALITFTLLVLGNDHQIGTVMRWLAGGFGDATWTMLAIPAAVLLIVGTGVVACSRQLNLLLVGDDGAAALGMNVQRFRILTLLAVSLLTAAAVAVSGTIGFIGLLIPHAAGYLVGRNSARLIPVAAVSGALALVIADIIARAVSNSTELPVGVVTGLIGAPLFLVMLWHRYGKPQ